MLCLCCVYVVSMLCLRCVYVVSMLCLSCVSVVSMLCLSCVYVVSMLCLCCVYVASMLRLCCVYVVHSWSVWSGLPTALAHYCVDKSCRPRGHYFSILYFFFTSTSCLSTRGLERHHLTHRITEEGVSTNKGGMLWQWGVLKYLEGNALWGVLMNRRGTVVRRGVCIYEWTLGGGGRGCEKWVHKLTGA